MSNNYQVVQIAARPARSAELRAARAAQLSESPCRVRPRAASRRALGRGTGVICVNTESSCCSSSSSAELRRTTSWALGTAAAQGDQPTAAERRQNAGGGGGGGALAAAGSAAAMARGPRPPMTVELAPVTRKDMIDTITVVGNLIGAATVDAVPRGQGRLDAVYVKLGDPVRRGQAIAKIEDREIVEQIKQAEATLQRVAGDHSPAPGRSEARAEQHGTVEEPLRARPAAPPDVRRHRRALSGGAGAARSLHGADGTDQIAPRRAEDQPGRIRSLRRRSMGSSASGRSIRAPASARTPRSFRWSTSAPCASSSTSSRKICGGFTRARRPTWKSTPIPGEIFNGRVARLAPILDPATRTAQVEIEIPNSTYRLKPGHVCARTIHGGEARQRARGAHARGCRRSGKTRRVAAGRRRRQPVFNPVTIGIEQQDFTEVTSGVKEGQRIITTGAAALRPGDRIVLAGQRGGEPAAPAAPGAAAEVAARRPASTRIKLSSRR